MSLAKLNILVTNYGDACHIDDKHQYYAHITDCEGNPVVWCNKSYVFRKMECGHLEVDIPPGCYTVFASQSSGGVIRPDGKVSFGNLLTHIQVVRVNCGDHACVTLFAPTGHYCGTWFANAITFNLPALEQAKIDVKLARAAVTAVQKFIATIEPDPYGRNVARFMDAGPPKKAAKK